MRNPYQPRPDVERTHPEWARSAAIYQLNQRQFTRQRCDLLSSRRVEGRSSAHPPRSAA